MSSAKLSEVAVDLVTQAIRDNLELALTEVGTDRGWDVTLETPPTPSYFIYPKAHGYRCPAIFVIDGGMDMRLSEMQSNFVNASLKMIVSVKVEDQDLDKITRKAWRYQAALFKVLNQIDIANSDNTVKLNVKVRSIKPSEIWTIKPEQPDELASFFKEYQLELLVDHYENF